ncbi:MAG TPA: 3'-5' exonuclease [Nannocystaceae bacterium]|nr:3'-5' exonuclease [Nannocystaceae bacterium]
MNLVPDFVAIDFETANRSPRSAVAMALVRVRSGEVADCVTTLLRPPTRSFTFTKIHGIDEAKVVDAPTFAAAWESTVHLLAGARFLAAHNASFDMEVLRACCDHARVAFPRQPWLCTVALARETWSLTNATLPSVCRRLALPLRHHDPTSDAAACASIVLAAWPTERGRPWIAAFNR